MAVDPKVLAGIAAALAADESNDELREHYASLLLDADRPVDALAQCQRLLVSHPASVDVLTLAHRAAHAAGQDEAAAGYRRLLGALGAAPPPLGPVAGGGSTGASPPSVAPIDPSGVPDSPEGILGLASIGDPNDLVGDPDVERPRITLADVSGMAQVKQRLELAFLGPARNPELRAAFGKSLRGGLLLYGPPGCGKTFIARALAGELRASFFGIGISEVLDMWVGSSERNLHDAFEQARRNAPCVLFLDELDAIGMKRSNLRNAPSMRSLVNQLLSELDGVDSDNEGVFVLGATNQPWEIDPALRRPGRFDRTVLVLPPDEEARLGILASNLRNRPVDEHIDLRPLAKATKEWSGADLSHLCETAAEGALARSMTEGRVSPISTADLTNAHRQLHSSIGSWFDVAANVATFGNDSGDYDDLAAYVRDRRRR